MGHDPFYEDDTFTNYVRFTFLSPDLDPHENPTHVDLPVIMTQTLSLGYSQAPPAPPTTFKPPQPILATTIAGVEPPNKVHSLKGALGLFHIPLIRVRCAGFSYLDTR